jgi:integrase
MCMSNKKESTHQLIHRNLTLYQREHSAVWQCRYKVDNKWIRATTKETQFELAVNKAKELLVEAEIRKRSGIPVVTKRFKDIAMLAIDRMERDLKGGLGKSIYKDYIRIINEHFIPSLGQRLITNIDYDALQQYYDDREAKYGLAISNSNRKTQNAAFNRVFDEAIVRGYLTESNRPKLDGKTKESQRRPAFELHELRALLKLLGPYIESGRTRDVRERREILRDYVEMLVDTGARPGIELLDMKWKQIRFMMNPISTVTDQLDEEGEVIEVHSLNRSCEMTVKGKTGQRQIIGRLPSIRVLERIALRNYGVKSSIKDPLAELIKPTNDDYIFRTKEGRDLSDVLNHMFDTFLADHGLLIDPKTNQKRVFYSLRHTYATLALTHDMVPIHTLAKQMGTSVLMIEKHYSHLQVIQAIEQLRGTNTRKLIEADNKAADNYPSKKRAEQELRAA